MCRKGCGPKQAVLRRTRLRGPHTARTAESAECEKGNKCSYHRHRRLKDCSQHGCAVVDQHGGRQRCRDGDPEAEGSSQRAANRRASHRPDLRGFEAPSVEKNQRQQQDRPPSPSLLWLRWRYPAIDRHQSWKGVAMLLWIALTPILLLGLAVGLVPVIVGMIHDRRARQHGEVYSHLFFQPRTQRSSPRL